MTNPKQAGMLEGGTGMKYPKVTVIRSRWGWRGKGPSYTGIYFDINDPDPVFSVDDLGPGGYGCEGNGHYIETTLPVGSYMLVPADALVIQRDQNGQWPEWVYDTAEGVIDAHPSAVRIVVNACLGSWAAAQEATDG